MTTTRQKELDLMTKEQLNERVNELFSLFQDITEKEQIALWPEYLYIKYKLQLLAPKVQLPL